jgi:hypothetical protein
VSGVKSPPTAGEPSSRQLFDGPVQLTLHVPVRPHFTSTLPLPPETLQPPFGQSTLQLELPAHRTLQLPPGQPNEQVPLLQMNAQLPWVSESQDSEHELHTHWPEPVQTSSWLPQAPETASTIGARRPRPREKGLMLRVLTRRWKRRPGGESSIARASLRHSRLHAAWWRPDRARRERASRGLRRLYGRWMASVLPARRTCTPSSPCVLSRAQVSFPTHAGSLAERPVRRELCPRALKLRRSDRLTGGRLMTLHEGATGIFTGSREREPAARMLGQAGGDTYTSHPDVDARGGSSSMPLLPRPATGFGLRSEAMANWIAAPRQGIRERRSTSRNVRREA